MMRSCVRSLVSSTLRRGLSTSRAASSSSAQSAQAAAPVYRPRRALLYMPGSSPKMLQKATTLEVDTVSVETMRNRTTRSGFAQRAEGQCRCIARAFTLLFVLLLLASPSVLSACSSCMDLEDAVAANQKAEARAHIVHALNGWHNPRCERLVRINPVVSGSITRRDTGGCPTAGSFF